MVAFIVINIAMYIRNYCNFHEKFSLYKNFDVIINFMINRRFLRVKVLQALYAYLGSGEEHVEEGVKHLLESIDKMHDLFVWQLSLHL